jgi:hypothetical protein
MKHALILMLCSIAGLSAKGYAAEMFAEDNDIEAEAVMADADASVRNADLLNQRADQDRLDSELDSAHTKKQLDVANSEKSHAESQIVRAEKEIQALKNDQIQLLRRKKLAQVERKRAMKKLVSLIQEVKASRALVKNTKMQTALEERALAQVKVRMSALQKNVRVQKAAPRLVSQAKREQPKLLKKKTAQVFTNDGVRR